ncbi:MAG: ABC-type transport auxiliary lipoprotein family protein [Alphaproteobacteria bacterium]|nr:ABC-type transport auxiliary lipoprotein family protein [Alphaproteobacteria bacterium]
MKKILALCACFVLLASCALTTPKDTGRAFMFALPPVETAVHAKAGGGSLTVALPTAAPELDTYRIALNREGQRWDYYAGARWADFLPLMVQDSLTKTLSDAKLFRTAATDQSGSRGEKILNVDIRAFQAEYESKTLAPVIKISLMVALRKQGEGTPAASFDIHTEAKAAQDSLSAIQAAFAAAFAEAQKQLVSKLRRRS